MVPPWHFPGRLPGKWGFRERHSVTSFNENSIREAIPAGAFATAFATRWGSRRMRFNLNARPLPAAPSSFWKRTYASITRKDAQEHLRSVSSRHDLEVKLK